MSKTPDTGGSAFPQLRYADGIIKREHEARRVWLTMGGERIVTYTLASESGASLRGAGWKPVAVVDGEGWDRPNRQREHQAVFDADKIRWEAVA